MCGVGMRAALRRVGVVEAKGRRWEAGCDGHDGAMMVGGRAWRVGV